MRTNSHDAHVIWFVNMSLASLLVSSTKLAVRLSRGTSLQKRISEITSCPWSCLVRPRRSFGQTQPNEKSSD